MNKNNIKKTNTKKRTSMKRQSAKKRTSVKRQSAKKRTSVKRQSAKKRTSVKRQSAKKRTSVKRQSAKKRTSVKRKSAKKRTSVKRQSAKKRTSVKRQSAKKKKTIKQTGGSFEYNEDNEVYKNTESLSYDKLEYNNLEDLCLGIRIDKKNEQLNQNASEYEKYLYNKGKILLYPFHGLSNNLYGIPEYDKSDKKCIMTKIPNMQKCVTDIDFKLEKTSDNGLLRGAKEVKYDDKKDKCIVYFNMKDK
jgi:hypothetical protein